MKNHMKKLLALLLALVMVFSLVACGAKEEAPAAKEEAPAAKEEAPAEEAASEDPIELHFAWCVDVVDALAMIFALLLI